MQEIFKDYLFEKHIFVHDHDEKCENAFESLFALANLFNIRIKQGKMLATKKMIETASHHIWLNVPDPFYRGFPQSVRTLSKDALLFDQLVHYAVTYGLGDFSEPGYSLFEEQFERAAFKENCEIKDFVIITESEAVIKLRELVDDLLKSARPLSIVQYEIVQNYIKEYDYKIAYCENKDTAIRLLLDYDDVFYARFITLADITKVVERIQYERYNSTNIKKLNLKNQDRKLVKKLIDAKFTEPDCTLTPYSNAVKECYERQAVWTGLLHHIHYKPVNDLAAQFVDGIRNGKNISVLSKFEKTMMKKDVEGAVKALVNGKGSGALLRKLNYVLSRCETEEEVKFVLRNIETNNPIILIQLLIQYASYNENACRTFKFTKYNKLRVHKETEEEFERRRSVVSEPIQNCVTEILRKNLARIYKGKLGKVYIHPDMKKMAVPLQENTSMGGFGTLSAGSRIHIPVEERKKIRAFTYWEKVDDIDLSAFGITEDGKQVEFSWRTMWEKQSGAITFSGDQTSGYHGGSEYFDFDLTQIREEYPEIKYLVVCNNVFSGTTFAACDCRAGYMIRDVWDSGQVWEPKTVQTSFAINCDNTFAYLFAINVETADFIWLNKARDSSSTIARMTSMQFLMDYFVLVDVFSVNDLFAMMATEVVGNPEKADVVVTNEEVEVKDGAEIIRAYDFEKILAYLNG